MSFTGAQGVALCCNIVRARCRQRNCSVQVLPSLGVKLPDLVISGINHGANLGGDILVSGVW